MSVKFFCNFCDKEIFMGLSKEDEINLTVSEIEQSCVCADCFLEEMRLQHTDEQEFVAMGLV